MELTKKLKEINKEYNYFNVIPENIKEQKLLVSVKDCICVKNMESTAGSEILKGYIPVFNATVVKRLIDKRAVIIGKTSQDEFGFGSFSVNTKNIPKNPYDKLRSCGGSSGGSAGITRKLSELKIEHVSIAESTGGSIA
ncbi:Asp-tRNA(Asn)/Glu-tRNA(Gln) amidotransferase subunit GatA, partial [Candidatus Woesearchaeota archaeon]|nr:Asp-tRNA(Asn)/Glu-tRNA(Gln) amidotransferase subunit GatA [Candidatus Woesearchaeota archaeon]